MSGKPEVIDREENEDDVLWLAMQVVGVKKRCVVQVAGHSRDVVQWWIWLRWKTWDENDRGVKKGWNRRMIG